MRIAAAQYASVPGDVARNVRRHVEVVERAAAQSVDVVVFPELSLVGYEPSLAADTAITQGDARLAPLQQASDLSGAIVAVGAPIVTRGLPQIGMLVFGPDAPVAVHAKRWLHQDEVPWFSPGDEARVFEVAGQRLAPAICFEALQREHVDAVAALGATVYLASVAKHARGVEEAHAFLVDVARHRGMSVVLANAVGPFADGLAAGRSAAWHPGGTLEASLDATSEGLVCIDVPSSVRRHSSGGVRALTS